MTVSGVAAEVGGFTAPSAKSTPEHSVKKRNARGKVEHANFKETNCHKKVCAPSRVRSQSLIGNALVPESPIREPAIANWP